MGSSARKRREKKKDFQKPKLKVGKTKPKGANVTDTSFRSKAKLKTELDDTPLHAEPDCDKITYSLWPQSDNVIAIVLNQQSLQVSAPSSIHQFSHHVSLLTSKSDSQRRDTLAYLTAYVNSKSVDSPLPMPVSVLLPKLYPLILDGSNSVRNQLLKLFRTMATKEVGDHAANILPYVRAGMTHLSADVRLFATEMLSWLVKIAGLELVSCVGGWFKTLNCFLTVLSWHAPDVAKWSAARGSLLRSGSEGRPTARTLQAMSDFIAAGISKGEVPTRERKSMFPLWHVKHHMISRKFDAFAYLNLFGPPRHEENDMLEDQQDRLRVFDAKFRAVIESGLNSAKQEGGEVGRAAATMAKLLRDNAPAEERS